MYKFIKLKDKNNRFDNTDVCIRLDAEQSLPDLLEAFKEFLMACGYQLDSGGSIEYISPEELGLTPDEEEATDGLDD
jgi:hypothetical protein